MNEANRDPRGVVGRESAPALGLGLLILRLLFGRTSAGSDASESSSSASASMSAAYIGSLGSKRNSDGASAASGLCTTVAELAVRLCVVGAGDARALSLLNSDPCRCTVGGVSTPPVGPSVASGERILVGGVMVPSVLPTRATGDCAALDVAWSKRTVRSVVSIGSSSGKGESGVECAMTSSVSLGKVTEPSRSVAIAVAIVAVSVSGAHKLVFGGDTQKLRAPCQPAALCRAVAHCDLRATCIN